MNTYGYKQFSLQTEALGKILGDEHYHGHLPQHREMN